LMRRGPGLSCRIDSIEKIYFPGFSQDHTLKLHNPGSTLSVYPKN
jgi:hypothetical protein